MARGAQDSAEGQIFYLVGHQRRTAWAACVFLPLYGAIGWFYGLRTHPDEMNAAFIMMMSLLIVPSVIFFYGCSRFRVRVDGRGSHWWFFGWHSWTWEDFESGRIFATDVGYKDPGKPWGRRSLPLCYLEDEDRAAVRALCRPHWHRPAPPAPPRSVTLTKFPWLRGWEKLHFHERGIDHTRRGHTQVYSWSDVREAVLLFGEQDVDSPVEYRFSIFGESIEIVMRSGSRWTDRCAAAALIGARMPKTRIRRIYFDEAGQNDEACEEKLRDFRSRLRLMERLCAAGKLFIFSVFVYFCWVALKALLDDPGTDLSFISFLALALAYVFIGWTIQSFQMEGERCALARKIRKLELQLSELRKRHSGPHATKPPAIEPDSRTRGDRAEVLPGGEIFLLAQNTRWMWRSLSGVSLLLAIFLVIRQYVSDPAYMVGAVVVSAIFVSVGTLFLITSFWRVRVDATGVHFWRFFRWHTWQWTAFQSGRIRAKYNGFEDPARHWGQRHLNLAALDARDRARVKDLCRAWWHRPEALPTPPEVSLKRRRLFRTAETIRLHAGGIDHTSGRRKQAYTWNDVRCCCLVYESLDEDGPVECQFNLPDCVLQYNLALGVNWLNRCAVAEIVRAHLPKPCVLLVGLDEMQNCASGCEIQIRHLEERRAHFRKTIRANSIALVLVAAVLLYFLIVCFLDGPGMPMKVPVIILLGAASYFLQSW